MIFFLTFKQDNKNIFLYKKNTYRDPKKKIKQKIKLCKYNRDFLPKKKLYIQGFAPFCIQTFTIKTEIAPSLL